ncbi:Aminoglycoside phosphotransferase [Penicillium coprophilum]|uniref:Aminoglycoside phosphotransferase n=1 Tax=Penicillium coprophilum TaxID=36646 RepID=UPI0023963C8C|nr:Aminoglycoside phosphotransferase [Penicillium coprophilum]KAJ5158018.1 Aminoglycoside phosphotransferase [Penicillium coprophilum]
MIVPVSKDPFSTLREAYTSRLDGWKEQGNVLGRSQLKLLRMFVNWIFQSSGEESFILSHSDPNILNFLILEDGSVRTTRDLDGSRAMPPSLGSESYPLWLMRDWDPTRWNRESMVGIMFGKTHRTQWGFYRIDAQCIGNLLPESENARVTRNPLLFNFRHLRMAAVESICNRGITTKVLGEVRKQMKNLDNSPPFNLSSNNRKDENHNENHKPSKKNAIADHNSPETDDKSEHSCIEADIGEKEDEAFYIDEMLLDL